MPFDQLSQLMGITPQDPDNQSVSDQIAQAVSNGKFTGMPSQMQSDPRAALQDLANNSNNTQQLADSGTPDINQELKDYLSKNVANQQQSLKDQDVSMTDKLKMAMNPALQGPPQPGPLDTQTPQVQRALNNNLNMAAMGIAQRAPMGPAAKLEAMTNSYENMPAVKQWDRSGLESLKDMLGKINERPGISAEDKAMAAQRFSSALKRAKTQGIDTSGLE